MQIELRTVLSLLVTKICCLLKKIVNVPEVLNTIKSSTKTTFNWMACSGFHFLIVWLPILKEDIGKVELGIDERIQNGEKRGGG